MFDYFYNTKTIVDVSTRICSTDICCSSLWYLILSWYNQSVQPMEKMPYYEMYEENEGENKLLYSSSLHVSVRSSANRTPRLVYLHKVYF